MVDQDSRIKKIKQIKKGAMRSLLAMADECACTMHWGGNLSALDIIAVLYCEILRNNQSDTCSDKFILSKGHAAAALYAIQNQLGIISDDLLLEYRKNGTRLTELAEYNAQIGIECSGGSLGLGLSYGAGMALLAKKNNYSYNTYVLLGDGELNEGAVWEAIMFAANQKLSNLIAVVDKNRFQSDGENVAIINQDNLSKQFEAFGWDVIEIDGHDIKELLNGFTLSSSMQPRVIIANTVKGNGISFMENDNSWHDRKITEPELEIAIKEVEGNVGY